MSTLVLYGAATVVALSVGTTIAYLRGRRHGRVCLPDRVVAELREHKLRCIGELPARVALELDVWCDTTRS